MKINVQNDVLIFRHSVNDNVKHKFYFPGSISEKIKLFVFEITT